MENKVGYVRKRDGRIVAFDKEKISSAIFKAAQSVGGEDKYLAEDLAEVVRLYLVKEFKGDLPSVEEIQDVVERVLIKTEHAKTAKAYILYREKRARARQLREGFSPEDLSEKEHLQERDARTLPLSVRRSDDNIGDWDKSMIVAALVRETAISENIAELIVREIEEEVLASKIKRLTSPMIREMVNAKLIQYGFEEERAKHARIGLPFYDVASIFEKFDGYPDALSLSFGRSVKREFVMTSVLPVGIAEKHLRGEIVVCNIEGADKYYSAIIPLQTGEREEMHRSLRKVEPFIEKSLFFRMPAGFFPAPDTLPVSSKGLTVGMEIASAGITEEYVKLSLQEGIPVLFRFVDWNEVENSLFIIENEISSGRIYIGEDSPVGIFLANRVLLNLSMINAYAEEQGFLLGLYIEEILKGCAELADRQESFIRKNRAMRLMTENFQESVRTVETGCVDLCNFTMKEELLSSLLNKSLSFSVQIPAQRDERDAFYRLIQTLMKDFAGKINMLIRIGNV